MADTILKKWNSTTSQWEELNPQTTHTQIVASGTPDSTTYLRGDGTWATVEAGTTFDGGTITGNIEISNTLPKINFTDTNNNSDYHIANNNGTLEIADTTNQEARIQIGSTGNITLPASGGLTLVDKAITNSSGALLWDGDEIYHEGHIPTLTELGAAAASHTHTFASITSKPTTIAGYGITDAYTKTQTDTNISTAISNLVDSSPATLDTLNELAAALGDDPNFATTITNALAGKLSTSGKAADSNLLDGIDSSGFLRVSANSSSPLNGNFAIGSASSRNFIQSHNSQPLDINPLGNSVTINGNTAFHDGYHPNADKLTTARNIALSGDVTGSANFDGSGNISITATVANDSHTHDGRYYTESEADGRFHRHKGTLSTQDWNTFIDGTETGYNLVANASGSNRPSAYTYGIEAHWSVGGQGKFQIYAPHNGSEGNGLWYRTGWNTDYDAWNRVFDNNYHPNADKWTTARTLSLTGDASGSTSWDGSGNASISVVVNNDSHTHDGRYYTESEADSRFVNVTGDTMTGDLVISKDNPVIVLKDTGETNDIDQVGYLSFRDSANVEKAWLGFGSSSNTDFNISNRYGGDINLIGGNVGVATSSPQRKLEVVGGHGDSTIRLRADNGANAPAYLNLFASEPGVSYNGVGIGNNINAQPYYGKETNTQGGSYVGFKDGNINFFTSPASTAGFTQRMTLQEGGNVGIGTGSPGHPLEVVGNMRTTGTFYVNQASMYNDSGSRMRSNVDWLFVNSNTYIYSTNIYLGDSSGDTIRTRGNAIIGNGFNINSSGVGEFAELNVQGNTVWSQTNLDFSLSGTTLTITTS